MSGYSLRNDMCDYYHGKRIDAVGECFSVSLIGKQVMNKHGFMEDLRLRDSATGEVSDCVASLEIELFSKSLDWHGMVFQRGFAETFRPDNVVSVCHMFLMIVESSLRWSAKCDGKWESFITQPGEIWTNPPGIPFSHILDEPCTYIMFAVTPERLWSSFDGGSANADQVQFLKNYNVRDNTLGHILFLIEEEVRQSGRNGDAHIGTLIRLFSSYYIRNYSNYLDLCVNSVPADSRIDFRKIDKYVSDHIRENISIDELALICGLSKYHFLRLFKRAKGITPYQFVLTRKLEYSRKLLQNASIPIVEIAHSLGFSDQSHFSNSFKKMYGYSPGCFRELSSQYSGSGYSGQNEPSDHF